MKYKFVIGSTLQIFYVLDYPYPCIKDYKVVLGDHFLGDHEICLHTGVFSNKSA